MALAYARMLFLAPTRILRISISISRANPGTDADGRETPTYEIVSHQGPGTMVASPSRRWEWNTTRSQSHQERPLQLSAAASGLQAEHY